MKERQGIWDVIRTVPVMAALALVPLIVTVKKYDTGLADYAWFPANDSSVDLFLYWKGRALILLAIVMVVLLAVHVMNRERLLSLWDKLKRPEILCVVLYFLLVLVSALLSEHRDFALGGSYEQWEGLNVLAAYVILLLYTYVSSGTEKMIRITVYSLILGSFLIGLAGTLQYLQMDFFRTETGRFFMNLLSEEKMRYTFNFSDGWVYATLYNPNYVGSYAALLLPVVVAVAIMDWKKVPPFWNILAIVTTCLLTITLLGSQSMTGCVAVAVLLVFFVIFIWHRMVAALGWKKIVAGAVGIAAFAGVICFMFPEELRYGTDKLFHPKEDYHVISSILDTESGLRVETVTGDRFYVELTDNIATPFSVREEDGSAITLEKTERGGYYTLSDDRYTNFRLYRVNVTVEGQELPAVRIFNPTINKEWTIALVDGEYQVFTAHKKLDKLREIPAFGFSGNQHFGDKRGYIWSRTFPLLNRFLLIGSGPDTFTEVFPNDDYVGKTNMNYDGVVVTKPHNMYLQIWVQTGLLSLLAFLGMFLLYFISSIRLYYRCQFGVLEEIGVALMLGCFGYMVAGLANDSTVAVAPVYWGMLGLGMAVNHLVRKKAE